MIESLVGTGTALVTPFTSNGDVDYDALSKIIEYNIRGGVNYLVSLGTTGEAVTLSREECQQVFNHTVRQVQNRVPIVFGVFGSNDTRTVLKRFETYDTTGATALLSASPYYNKPTQEGIFQHYKTISEHSPLPIIAYNVPGRTASNISAETTIRMSHELEGVLGIKEASADLVQLSKIVKHADRRFMVWSGDDPTALAACALGAHGVISVISNAFPYEFSAMISKVLKGDIEMSRKLHLLLLDIHDGLYAEGNPVGVKGALSIMGYAEDHVRLPLVSMSSKGKEGLRELIAKIIDKSSYSSYYS